MKKTKYSFRHLLFLTWLMAFILMGLSLTGCYSKSQQKSDEIKFVKAQLMQAQGDVVIHNKDYTLTRAKVQINGSVVIVADKALAEFQVGDSIRVHWIPHYHEVWQVSTPDLFADPSKYVPDYDTMKPENDLRFSFRNGKILSFIR